MIVQEFFDEKTFTLTYVLHKEGHNKAIVMDPVLDFEASSGQIDLTSVNKVLSYMESHGLEPEVCIETHAHADHLSGSQIIKDHFPATKIAVSQRIVEVQKIFSKLFNIDAPADGSQFDLLFQDNETVNLAGLDVKVIPTPGHTPACTSFLIEGDLFVGDAIFMPDYGVGRCDFPGGSASQLHRSITENIFSLPESTKVYVGHDYQPGGRELRFVSTVGEQKESNKQLNASMDAAEFIQRREERDKTLNAPKLLYPSIQVNILGGKLPEPEDNGMTYLKIPIKSHQAS